MPDINEHQKNKGSIRPLMVDDDEVAAFNFNALPPPDDDPEDMMGQAKVGSPPKMSMAMQLAMQME